MILCISSILIEYRQQQATNIKTYYVDDLSSLHMSLPVSSRHTIFYMNQREQ